MAEWIPRFASWLACMAAIAAAGDARADEAAGKQLATQWCADCHAVAPGQRSPNRSAPPFANVAKDPAVTETALRTFLRSPHAKMPDINLNRDQVSDLVAYILSLKPPG